MNRLLFWMRSRLDMLFLVAVSLTGLFVGVVDRVVGRHRR